MLIVTESINDAVLVFFRSADGFQLLEKIVVAREDGTVAALIDNYLRAELFKVVLLC